MPILLTLALTVVLGTQRAEPRLLGEVLKSHNVPVVPEISDTDHRITSYEVFDTGDWFAIAYYRHRNDERLDTLTMRAFNRRDRRWRATVIDETFGSILGLEHHGERFYVTGHYNPSAAPTLVLSSDLRRIRVIQGWPVLMLPDGRVVIHGNAVHFAPAHPAELTIYDPKANTLTRLYPVTPDPDGYPMFDRRIVDVAWNTVRRVVTFSTTEQLVDVNRDNARVDAGPERRYTVTCTVARSGPRCNAAEAQNAK